MNDEDEEEDLDYSSPRLILVLSLFVVQRPNHVTSWRMQPCMMHGKASLSHAFQLIMSSARASSRFLCEHCNRSLSKTQFYKHKRMYYDKYKRRWLKDRVKPNCNTDFNFGDDVVSHGRRFAGLVMMVQ